MYPCLMVFASVRCLIVIQKNAAMKDLVNMIAPCSCTIAILRDYTVFYRQPLNDSLVNMLLNNV